MHGQGLGRLPSAFKKYSKVLVLRRINKHDLRKDTEQLNESISGQTLRVAYGATRHKLANSREAMLTKAGTNL